jgi:hypothetical protein
MLTLPLSILGSQGAHSLAYRIVETNHADRVEALAKSGHDYMAYSPLGLAVCSVLVGIGLLSEMRLLLGGRGRRPPTHPAALPFAVLAPSIFVLQEYFERLAHDGAVPWGAALESTFLVGLVLQLPLALAAYISARLLLRVAVTLVRRMGGVPRRWIGETLETRPGEAPFHPCIASLARGFGSRGPPPLVAV